MCSCQKASPSCPTFPHWHRKSSTEAVCLDFKEVLGRSRDWHVARIAAVTMLKSSYKPGVGAGDRRLQRQHSKAWVSSENACKQHSFIGTRFARKMGLCPVECLFDDMSFVNEICILKSVCHLGLHILLTHYASQIQNKP